MHSIIKSCLIGLSLPLLLFSSLLHSADSPVIAAAASVKFAMRDIEEAFRRDTGKTVRFSFASSGNLTRQIRQGAPFELFLSANRTYVKQLQKQKLAQDNQVVFALGRLVLLTTADSKLDLDGQLNGIRQAITDGSLKRFTIANPEFAPYGVAARETLQRLNLWDLIQPRLVLGENVAQAAQFASSGAVQAGLISNSLALAPALQNKTRRVLIPLDIHSPLEQTMVLLNNSGETARQFFQFILSDKARAILSRYGYTTP